MEAASPIDMRGGYSESAIEEARMLRRQTKDLRAAWSLLLMDCYNGLAVATELRHQAEQRVIESTMTSLTTVAVRQY